MTFKAISLFGAKGVCSLDTIQNVPEWAEMHHGEPQEGKFPEEAHFVMNPRHPKDIKLADALDNKDGLLVFSEKLVDFLKKHKALKNNEVLPVGIVNHKGRREKARYFVVHQIERPKCVDGGKTKGVKSPLLPDKYQFLDKLVLNEKKIDPAIAIFRPDEAPTATLFRSDLADKILAAEFTGGIEFFPLDAFDDDARFEIRMGTSDEN